MGIFVFMYTWNDLLVSMVLIGKADLRTISVGLLNFVGARKSDYGALMAAIFISILPPLFDVCVPAGKCCKRTYKWCK